MRLTLALVCSLAINAFASSSSQGQSNQLPVNYGVVIFPTFQALDVFGPLDALNLLSGRRTLNLSIIAATLDPVSTMVRSENMNTFNSSFGQSVVPTHTFETAPDNIEVLLVPGGLGTRSPDRDPLVDYIRKTYPSLKYILSVCTGAGLLAEAGVLDGKSATTNKQAWHDMIAKGSDVNWVPEARWVIDGNVWTSAGVSAGIDLMLAFIDAVYGTQAGEMVGNWMEYRRHVDWRDDPFAKMINATAQ